DQRLLKAAPRFHAVMNAHRYGLFDGMHVSECPTKTNSRGEHLLALVDADKLTRVLSHLLSENEFLSEYGVRAVSRVHAERRDLGHVHGIGRALIEYVPGESTSGLFGGNSNWRGPIWMPTNYVLIQAIERYHRFLGDDFKVPVPCLGNQELTLNEIAKLVSDPLVDTFRRTRAWGTPGLPPPSPLPLPPA